MKTIDIAFLWHMHQPFYKDNLSGKYLMPWVRLHGVKDYFPMAALVERHDGVKANFNLVPVLVEQINDYVENNASDRHLDLTVKKASSLTHEEKLGILGNFFKVNFKRFIEPNARYSELLIKKGTAPLSGQALMSLLDDFSTQDWLDLQVLFNMAWFHSISIDEDINLKGLKEKGRDYTEEDKEYVIARQGDILSRIIPLYRRLEEEARIEITTTPYYHPILPLICDTSIARLSSPGMALPKRFAHPEDARWQVEEAIRYHTAQFGRPPRGMWPAEGSVSDEAMDIIISSGIKWVAADEDVLFKSLSSYGKAHRRPGHLDRRLIYRPYRLKRPSGSAAMIFRDKNLSDMISFTYNGWGQAAAAEDLIGHFRNISANMRRDTDRGLVTIVMDGENAWEYYEDNGKAFFETLYSRLKPEDGLNTTTVSEHLAIEHPRKTLDNIFPASWINHNFEIWIGQEQDNASWDYLSKVRSDLTKLTGRLRIGDKAIPDEIQKAWREFYISEGSDWNWWYTGRLHSRPDNPFDKLYRSHLKSIYKTLKLPAPDFLKNSIA